MLGRNFRHNINAFQDQVTSQHLDLHKLHGSDIDGSMASGITCPPGQVPTTPR
jgi:hypothetical protein